MGATQGLVQTVAEEVRGRIQEELYTMLAGAEVDLDRMSRRILITGLSTYWGSRLAQVLERDPANEAIIGVSPRDPALPLERTEFVRVGTQHALLRRIVHAAEIDTVIDTRLVVDSKIVPERVAHEMNVLGTMNILAACGGPDSPVTKFVFKSSAHYYGCERDDPSFFTEQMQRPHPPRTRLESDIVEAEDAVQEFAARNAKVTVTTLRFCNGLGPDLDTTHSALLSLPVVPGHPRVRPALPVHPRGRHRRRAPPRGRSTSCPASTTPRRTACWRCRRSRACWASRMRRCCRRSGRAWPAAATGRIGIRIPEEVLRQLRYGRGQDNRKLKQSGYRFALTTRETVQEFAAAQRLKPLRESGAAPYRYEREVEEFLRWSPSVRRDESGR